MKNKTCVKRIVKSAIFTAMSAFLSLLVFIGLMMGCVWPGFRPSAEKRDYKTITVNYDYIDKATKLDSVCKASFKDSGIRVVEVSISEEEGEIKYFFKTKVSDEKIQSAVAELKADIEDAKKTGGKLAGSTTITHVSEGSIEEFQSGTPKNYVLRAAIALTIFSVLAFVYVALRYKLSMGLSMHASMVVTVAAVLGLVGLFRIPVGSSFGYALVFAAFMTVAFNLINFNRFRDNAKDKDKQKGMSSVEKVECAIQRKTMVIVAVLLAAAILLVGILAKAVGFAFTCVLGLAVALYSAWIVSSAMLVAMDSVIKTKDRPVFRGKRKTKKQKANVVKAIADDSAAEESVEEAEEVEEQE